MSLFKARQNTGPAYADRLSVVSLEKENTCRLRLFMRACLTILCFLAAPTAKAATYTLNVSLATSTVNPSALQQDILSNMTTGQYLGKATASAFFANTYSVTVTGKNLTYTGPSVSTTLITLDTIANKLTAISTYTHLTGYAQGMMYERVSDASALGYFMGLCANATNYVIIPSTIPLPFTWSKDTCNQVLGFMDNWIVTQTSGIAVIPNPPPGF